MVSTQPNPTRLMWVGLDLCDWLGWVEFFLTRHGGLGQKIPLTRPMYNPSYNHFILLSLSNIFIFMQLLLFICLCFYNNILN